MDAVLKQLKVGDALCGIMKNKCICLIITDIKEGIPIASFYSFHEEMTELDRFDNIPLNNKHNYDLIWRNQMFPVKINNDIMKCDNDTVIRDFLKEKQKQLSQDVSFFYQTYQPIWKKLFNRFLLKQNARELFLSSKHSNCLPKKFNYINIFNKIKYFYDTNSSKYFLYEELNKKWWICYYKIYCEYKQWN